MESGARRVGDDDLRPDAVAHQRRKHVAHLTRQKGAVRDPVRPSVPHGVGDRRRRHLDPVDPPTAAREQKTDRARAGVEIQHGLVAREAAGALDDGEESLGLGRVGLEERVGRYLEAEPPERRPDVVPPEEQVLLCADRHARLLGVHVQHDARRRGHAARELGGQGSERLHVGRRRHDVHHRLAGAMALAQGQRAPGSRVGTHRADRSSPPTAAGTARCPGRRRNGRPGADRRLLERGPRGRDPRGWPETGARGPRGRDPRGWPETGARGRRGT